MPDMAQQAEADRDSAQADRDEPGRHHHHRHRCNIDAKQIDLGESHRRAPASKYPACWASNSERARILARARRAVAISGSGPTSSARWWSMLARDLRAIAVSP